MRHARTIAGIVPGVILAATLQAAPPLPGHILLLDTSIGLIDINPVTGESFTVVPGAIGRTEMAIDADGDVLVVEFDSIVRIDPATGAQSTVASGLRPVGTNLFAGGIAIERNGNLLVTLQDNSFPNKTTPGRILRVDPSNGTHTTLASDNLLGVLQGIAVDDNGDILVVTQELSVPGPPAGIVRVDPATGAQSNLSTGSAYDLPAGIVLDTDGTILVSDYGSAERILRVDPGDVDPMPVVVTSGGLFNVPFGLDVESDGHVVVGNIDSARVVRVDPGTGQQSLVNAPGNFDVPLFPRVLTYLVKNGKPLGRLTTRSSQTLAPGDTLEGHGTIDASVVGAVGSTISATTGDMTLGDATLAGGFSTQGNLHTGANTVVLRTADAAILGGEISILGGTLRAATGITLSPGAELVAEGTIDADVVALPGSSMLIGNLMIGGVVSYGSINVNGGTQSFTGPVANHHEINVFNATLGFQGDGAANNDGLTNFAELRLADTIVNGDVHSPDGSVIRVIDSAVFSGLVSGAADFPWPGLVRFNGVYDPGDSTASITFAGGVAFDAAATLHLDIGGTQAGTSFDQLNIAGSASLGGTAAIEITGGFDPQPGQSFVVMSFGSRIDEFDDVTGLGVGADRVLTVAYHDNDVTLTVAELVLADFDADGDVDLDDFGEFQVCSTGPAQGPPPPGCPDKDLDGDGDIDQDDFGIFQRCISGASQPADPGCTD